MREDSIFVDSKLYQFRFSFVYVFKHKLNLFRKELPSSGAKRIQKENANRTATTNHKTKNQRHTMTGPPQVRALIRTTSHQAKDCMVRVQAATMAKETTVTVKTGAAAKQQPLKVQMINCAYIKSQSDN